MKKKWWHNSVVYQIYPRSFNDSNGDGVGDLRGIINKLDHVKELGADVIWLSPVYKSPMKDNGYDISDYQAIEPVFGTMEDMDELIKEADNRGIKIVMDLVVNHTSDQHEWFKESRKSKDNPYRDYYIWRDEEDTNDIASVFSGPTWKWDEEAGQYYFHLFADEQPDLNWENPKVQEEIHKMINWWLEKGIGGFRLDVIDLIGKEVDKKITGNGPRLHPLIKQMNKETFGNYDVLTVGETWGATPEIAMMYSAPEREEFSMIFQFEHMVIDWDQDHGKWKPHTFDFVKLKEILSKWQVGLKGKGWNSLFWNNHDLPRIVSRWGNDKEYRYESATALATILHGMQGTPYVFQGEEIGMTNVKYDSLKDYNDVEIHGAYQEKVLENKVLSEEEFMVGVYQNGRDNARTPIQWNEKEHGGFTTGTPWLKVNQNYLEVNVEADKASEKSVFNYYKNLISIRKSDAYSDLIVYGDYEAIDLSHQSLFAYKRINDEREILVVVNFSEEELNYSFDGNIKEVLASNYNKEYDSLSDLVLLPYESLIVELN